MLSLKDFIKMEEIDSQYFLKDNIAPAEESYKWYLIDKNSCIALKEKGEVIAYVNILSLTRETFEMIKNNQMNESKILVKDLELNKEKYFNYLYFSCIAIDKNHRNLKVLKKLLEITMEHLNYIILKGITIKEVMADCSTPEGEKITQTFLKLKPYQKTSHNSVIYVLDGNSFMGMLKEKNSKIS